MSMWRPDPTFYPSPKLAMGKCCKRANTRTMGVGLTELDSSGEFEQPCNERNLPRDVALRQPSHLSLPDHVHRLDALNRARRRPERAEALPGPDASFQGAVVLLHGVVQVPKVISDRWSSGGPAETYTQTRIEMHAHFVGCPSASPLLLQRSPLSDQVWRPARP